MLRFHPVMVIYTGQMQSTYCVLLQYDTFLPMFQHVSCLFSSDSRLIRRYGFLYSFLQLCKSLSSGATAIKSIHVTICPGILRFLTSKGKHSAVPRGYEKTRDITECNLSVSSIDHQLDFHLSQPCVTKKVNLFIANSYANYVSNLSTSLVISFQSSLQNWANCFGIFHILSAFENQVFLVYLKIM